MASETPPAKPQGQGQGQGLEHQDQSIKARKFQLFDEGKVEEAGSTRPFASYVAEAPPDPLSPVAKAALCATGALVVLLFLGAILLGGPKKVKRPQTTSAPSRLSATSSVAHTCSPVFGIKHPLAPPFGEPGAICAKVTPYLFDSKHETF